MKFHDLEDAGGQVAARLGADCDLIKDGLGIKLSETVNAVVTFFVGVTLAFAIRPDAWKLALVILACIPFMVVAMGAMGHMMKARAKKTSDLSAAAASVATEALRNIRIVMSYGGYDVEVQKYQDKLEHARDVGTQSGCLQGLTVGVMIFSMYTTYAIGLYYGGQLIIEAREAHPECIADPTGANCFSGGDVLTVFFSMIIGGMAIARISPGIIALASARAAAHTLFETIDAETPLTALPDEAAPDMGKTLPEVNGGMQLKGVSFAYPSRPEQQVLTDINIDIPPGKTVALVGPSGSGKSTVAQLVQRLYDPSEGTVTFDGVDVKELNVDWLRQQQGVVSQQPVLFAASIKENILAAVPLDARDRYGDAEVREAAKVALAHGFITELKDSYETDVGTSGGLLSGGQKQRVSIARAIIHPRPMQIWDEATSALDSANEAAVQAALDNLSQADGMGKPSTLVIAHRLSTIRNADIIYVMQEGRVVESGTHDVLVADPNSLYHKLWSMQELMGEGESKPMDGAAASDDAPADLPQVRLASAGSTASAVAMPAASVPGAPAGDAKAQEALQDLVAVDENAKDADKKLEAWKMTLPEVPLSRVWQYTAPEGGSVLAGFLFAVVAGSITPLFALVFTEVLAVFYNPDSSELEADTLFYMGMFFAVAGAGLISHSSTISLLTYAGGHMTTRLQMDAYRSMLKQDVGFFDLPQHSAGRLVGRLSKDAQSVRAITGVNMSMTLQQVSTISVGVVIAFLASWRVALVVLAIMPLLGLAAKLNFKYRSGFAKASVEENKEMAHLTTEAIINIRTVQSLGLERALLRQFAASQDPVNAQAVSSAYFVGVVSGFSMFVMLGSYALVFYLGGQWISDGVLTFPDLVQAMMVLIFAAQGLGHMSAYTVDAGTAEAAKRSMFQLIDMQSTIDPTDTSRKVPPHLAQTESGHSLTLTNVSFNYPSRPDQPVLKNASLTIPAGKTVALVGESGSGKSTVVQLFQRFYDVDAGTVSIDGVDVKELPVAWLRSCFGWVPQEPRLFADSVAYNVGYGMLPDKLAPDAGVPLEAQEKAAKAGGGPVQVPDTFTLPAAIPSAASTANAAEFVERLSFKYATHVGPDGGQLSGGQRQRVALARCLVREPGIMLLDEATSALDSESEKIVQASIDAVLAEAAGKRTTIVIAHRLSTIRKADVVVVLQRGKVVETGTHDGLIAAGGVYANMVAAQSGITVEEVMAAGAARGSPSE